MGSREVEESEIQSLIADVSKKVDAITDYRCLIIKRERIEGRLSGYEYIAAKIRHEPLGVYLRFLKPDNIYDREVMYTGGRHLTVKKGGNSNPNLTLQLKINSPLAISKQRYTIDKIGIKSLVDDLKVLILEELKYPTTITAFENVKLYDRAGTLYRLEHKTKTDGQRCMAAEIIIDSELGIPVYFKSWGWSSQNKPLLLEEYAYKDIELDVEFTDKDFDTNNVKYGFTNGT
jgi:hypothetical protein